MKKRILSLTLILAIMLSYATTGGIAYADALFERTIDFNTATANTNNAPFLRWLTATSDTSTWTVDSSVNREGSGRSFKLMANYKGNWYLKDKGGYISSKVTEEPNSTYYVYNTKALEYSYYIRFSALTGSGVAFADQLVLNNNGSNVETPIIKINVNGNVYVGSDTQSKAKISAGAWCRLRRMIDFTTGEVKAYLNDTLINETTKTFDRAVRSSVSVASTFTGSVYIDDMDIRQTIPPGLDMYANYPTYTFDRGNVNGQVNIVNDGFEKNIMILTATYDGKKLDDCYLKTVGFEYGEFSKTVDFECGEPEANQKIYTMVLCGDNLKPIGSKFVYTPKGIVDITGEKIYPSDDDNAALLASNGAIHMMSGVAYKDGNKITYDNVPYYQNDEYMVPVDAAQYVLGKRIAVSGDKITTDNGAVFTVGTASYTYNGSTKSCEAPAMLNDVCYVPFGTIATKVYGKKLTHKTAARNGGLVVVSDSDFSVSSSKLQNLNDFVFYERPDPEEILNNYQNSSVYGQHPRIMMSKDDVARLKKEVANNSKKKAWYSRLKQRADQITGYDPVVYELRDGVRLMYVAEEFNLYILILGLTYQLSGDSKYAEAAWSHIESVVSFPNWNPAHHIDVGIMSAAFAIAYDWMYDYWTPERKQIMENAIYKHSFYVASETYKDSPEGMGGVTLAHNHNSFCNGGISLAAFSFMDAYPEICSSLASDAVRCVEYLLNTYDPYGSTMEGFGYSKKIYNYLSKMFSSLKICTGSLYGLDKAGGLKEFVNYLDYMQSDVGAFNYGENDSSTSGATSEPSLLWFYEHYKIAGMKDNLISLSPYKYNYNEDLVPLIIWYNTEAESGSASFELDKYYPDEEVITARSGYGRYHSFVGFRAGPVIHDAFNAHMDQGAFVFDALGQRWAYDLGKDDYNISGYNDKYGRRWNIFRLRSEGHNTITINPSTSPGYDIYSSASVEKFESEDDYMLSVINMSDLQKNHANSAKRALMLTDERRSLVVRDEISLKSQSDIYWIMYTKADVNIAGNKVTLTQKNQTVEIDFITSHAVNIYVESAAPMSTAPVVSGQSDNAEYKRLVCKVSASGNANITAKLTPKGYGKSEVSAYDKPIAQW